MLQHFLVKAVLFFYEGAFEVDDGRQLFVIDVFDDGDKSAALLDVHDCLYAHKGHHQLIRSHFDWQHRVIVHPLRREDFFQFLLLEAEESENVQPMRLFVAVGNQEPELLPHQLLLGGLQYLAEAVAGVVDHELKGGRKGLRLLHQFL